MLKEARPIRFKLAWQGYRVGDVIGQAADNPVPATLREWLIGNGFAESVLVPAVDLSAGKPAKARTLKVR